MAPYCPSPVTSCPSQKATFLRIEQGAQRYAGGRHNPLTYGEQQTDGQVQSFCRPDLPNESCALGPLGPQSPNEVPDGLEDEQEYEAGQQRVQYALPGPAECRQLLVPGRLLSPERELHLGRAHVWSL